MVGSVHSFDYFKEKNEFDVEDYKVVQGVVPYVLQSLVRSDKVLPDRLEKAKRSLMVDNNIVITSAGKGGQVVIMDRMESNIAMMCLLMGPGSHYEKKSVHAMNVAHRNNRREVEFIGGSRTVCRGTFRRGTFRRGTFRRKDTSP